MLGYGASYIVSKVLLDPLIAERAHAATRKASASM